MLILRRKKNESILIGDNIRITLLECASDGVRIAIDAPKQISIIREELSEAERINKAAIWCFIFGISKKTLVIVPPTFFLNCSNMIFYIRRYGSAMANYIKNSANSESNGDSEDISNANA